MAGRWLKKYTSVLGAIGLTFTVAASLYAFEIKPRLDKEIKVQIETCQEKYIAESIERDQQLKMVVEENSKRQTNRLLKIECGLYTIMSAKDKNKTNELFEQLGGTK
jgi:hypothetical protein